MSYWDDVKNKTTQDGVSTSSDKIIQEKALRRITKNIELHKVKASKLSDLCIKPKLNEQYRIITEKQFNAFAFILHVLETELVDEMYLAIYRINEPTVSSIIDFIECGKIQKATFIISNFFNQTKKPEKWAIKLKEFADNNNNTNFAYVHNHSKVVILKTNNNNYYVFEGSGNMSDNARIEQYIYENNKEVYEFHKEWMRKLILT